MNCHKALALDDEEHRVWLITLLGDILFWRGEHSPKVWDDVSEENLVVAGWSFDAKMSLLIILQGRVNELPPLRSTKHLFKLFCFNTNGLHIVSHDTIS